MNFAQNLRALRERKGVTQQQNANHLGVRRPTYTRYELGTNEPNFSTLCVIADYFGVTTDQLLGRAPLPEGKAEKEVKKMENDQTQRLEECLLDFVERVSKGGATTEAEVQVLPEVAQVLANLRLG